MATSNRGSTTQPVPWRDQERDRTPAYCSLVSQRISLQINNSDTPEGYEEDAKQIAHGVVSVINDWKPQAGCVEVSWLKTFLSLQGRRFY